MNAITQLQVGQEEIESRLPTEQQLRDSQKMEAIGRLVGGVAHDFNNLLTGMVLCSELILTGLDKNSRLRHFAEEIRSAGEQGVGLIQQLLAVARQRTVEMRVLVLNDVISEVHNLLTRLIGENIELVSELADDLGVVKIDLAEVQQIILNLVLNARDAMPEGGRIVLTTRNSNTPIPGCAQGADSWIEFLVTDSGCGMDADTRSHLFEPFFTTKKPGRGSGLGLATVYRIVTHAGGNIVVESETGKGTRVLVRLPQLSVATATNRVAPIATGTTSALQRDIVQPRKAKSARGKSA